MAVDIKSTLGTALRAIRHDRGWSLADASRRSGLAISTLSKIENGQRSLTYDKLIGLAGALEVDITRLFSTGPRTTVDPQSFLGRRSVHRQDAGFVIEAGVYSYRYLADELVAKRFSPIIMELHAGSIEAFDGLLRHAGEEFAFVLEGEVELHTELYAPLRLKMGESIYFDSNVGHAYLNVGDGVARILTIASAPAVSDDPRDQPMAQPSRG
ncbi:MULTISPECIES: helix-turn-helix domain-containing protein [unclassified Sphingomonas]|uniref:helix-turn-helix domain-containing protein n=1 Tax=unclassified Sphingomonas TaxID=196159 RepID=UPI00070028B9|nr:MULTISPECIES: XRE family transcriptional regulator [unclassified Sphingomonas]KQX25024.1 hypothetical protein ASD17_23365 [Sphingomonas sp. Root1294]KQY66041.1 hypothetical protein ASD39_13165 [Sphingomonas sp. Root50]KRB89794.1 hypothetical protein ASE22_19430 [Sphingomonas sp. Root720]